MSRFTKLLVCFLFAAIPATGQTPKIAATGPVFSASLGYSYFNLGLQPSRANLDGLDTTFTADFRPRFGVAFDLGYARGSDVNGTTRHADVLSYLAGPVVYITRNRGLTTHAHVLGRSNRKRFCAFERLLAAANYIGYEMRETVKRGMGYYVAEWLRGLERRSADRGRWQVPRRDRLGYRGRQIDFDLLKARTILGIRSVGSMRFFREGNSNPETVDSPVAVGLAACNCGDRPGNVSPTRCSRSC